MRIIRHPLDGGFTTLPNSTLRDPNLSLKSKGLLGLMLSHVDGFDCTIKQMQSQCTDRRDSIKAGLRELRAAGYVMDDRDRSPDGRVRTVLIVSSVPRFEPKPENPQKSGSESCKTAEKPADGGGGGRSPRGTVKPAALEEQLSEKQLLEDQNTTTRARARMRVSLPTDLTDQEKAVVVVELEKLEEEEQQQQVVDVLAGQFRRGRRPTFLRKWVAEVVAAAQAGEIRLDTYATEQARLRRNRRAEAAEQAARDAEQAALPQLTAAERKAIIARARAAVDAIGI